jgi:hypothetical protein
MTTLTNGRVYIGKTVRGYLRRWKEHKDELNRGRHYNVWLQEDWNILGEKGFSFEILVECDSEDDLNRTEIALIDKFQSYDPSKGYNRTFGGDGEVIPSRLRSKSVRHLPDLSVPRCQT